MNHGKETCRMLKELRHKIADANDIVLETSECRFKGECTGTCPRCEAEVRYLERQLAARRRSGKAIRLVGLTAGAIIMSGCGSVSDSKPTETLSGEVIDTIMAEEMCDTVDDIKTDEIMSVDTIPASKTSVTAKDSVISGKIASINDNKDLRLISSIDFGRVETDNEPVYVAPQFPGGESALEKFISDHINYPTGLSCDSVSGSVIVEITIDADGKVTDPVVLKGIDPILDRQALKIAGLLPDFTPATLDNYPIKSLMKLSVKFEAPVTDNNNIYIE